MLHRTVSRLSILVAMLGLLAACMGDSSGSAATAPTASGGTATNGAPAATKAPTTVPTPRPPTPIPTPVPTIPSIAQVLQGLTPEGYHYLGRADAPVTIVQYGDFLCRACATYVTETEPQIIQNYVANGKAKLVYIHAANLGDLSVRMSESTECMGEIGRFWEMRFGLYQRQKALFGTDNAETALGKIAQELGANQATYNKCMEEREHLPEVLLQANEAKAAGETDLPLFDINGAKIAGAKSYDELAKAIDAAAK